MAAPAPTDIAAPMARESSGPLTLVWHVLRGAVPGADAHGRQALLVALAIGVCALAATWAAFLLYRGRARWLTAVCAAPVAALGLSAWAQTQPTPEVLAQLPIALTSTVAVSLAVRPLVHHGFVTAAAQSRAVFWAALTALLCPRAGLGLLAILAIAGWLSRRRGASTAAALRRWAKATAVGAGPPLIALVVWSVWGGTSRWPDWASLHLSWPTTTELRLVVGAAVLYPALALVVLLVTPLRWRGGLVLCVLGVAGTIVSDGDGVLAPMPSLILLTATTLVGWIWLAGTAAPPRFAGTARVLSTAAGVLTLGVAGASMLRTNSLQLWADGRAPLTVHRIYERGLVAPGDAVLVFGPWSRSLALAQRYEGWRPDITWLRGNALPRARGLTFAIDASGRGRRVLSNSFTAGGQWPRTWVAESGALFWMIGHHVDTDDDFTAPGPFPNDLGTMPEPARTQLAKLILERARFRRAAGDPLAALSALPLAVDSRRGIRIRLQLAKSARAFPGGSELPRTLESTPENLDALWRAEAGDLLFAHGEHERATEVLAEAAAAGYPDALGGLARWQVRAGARVDAQRTLAAIRDTPAMRGVAVDLLHWLSARNHLREADRLAASLAADDREPAAVLGARLGLLQRSARVPTEGDDHHQEAAPVSRR